MRRAEANINGTVLIDNKCLTEEVLKFQQTGIASDKLGQILLDLTDNVLLHKNWRNYKQDLKDDMRSRAIEKIMKYGLPHFNPDKGSTAFSYFTRICFTSYMEVVARYYKNLNNHQKYIRNCLEKYICDTNSHVAIESLNQFQTSFESTQDDN